jgi:hypothetical protein
LIPLRKWWLGVYHCPRGAAWAENNELSLGAEDVKIIKVNKPKRNVIFEEIDLQTDILNLGCIQKMDR